MVSASTDAATIAAMARSSESRKLFHQKLERLVRDHVKTEIDEAAGLPRGSVSVYLSRGTVPQPESAIRLARGLESLGVHAPVEWLFDEDDERLDPPPRQELESVIAKADIGVLLREIQHRYHNLLLSMNELLNWSERLLWVRWAIWLLAKCPETKMPPAARAMSHCLKKLKESGDNLARLRSAVVPGSGLVSPLEAFAPPMPLETIDKRFRSLLHDHIGTTAIHYWLMEFDEDYPAPGWETERGASTEWKDRRAWLLAQLVTDESVADDEQYEPVRKRLHEIGYIDDQGKPRWYGDPSQELGYFDLPEPE